MQLLKWMPPVAKRVIEFGCEEGLFAEQFKTVNPLCDYIGIEEEDSLARCAVAKVDHIFCGDASDVDFSQFGLQEESVDCIVYHNLSVWDDRFIAALIKHVAYLRQDGQILFNLPNPHYIRNICGFLMGKISGARIDVDVDMIVRVCQTAGLFLCDRVLYGTSEDEALREDKGLVSAYGEILKRCKPNDMDTMFAQGVLLRFTKYEAEKLLLQTMVGDKICAYLRIYEPHSFCETVPGVRVISDVCTADLSLGESYVKKVFIKQRIWHQPEQVKMLIDQGYLVITEIDDSPDFWKCHSEQNYFDFRACHGIQVSTPELADCLRQFNPNIRVFPNHILSLPKLNLRDNSKPINIFFGALHRKGAWNSLMPILNEMLSQYGERVKVIVLHDKEFFDTLSIEHKEYIPFCPYIKYKEVLCSCDIALLPLNDTKFNRMKSDLKFIESASLGTAVLASPCVYEQSIKHGKTGLIYKNDLEFRAYLALLIENDEVRNDIIRNAYNYVKQERMLMMHYRERYEWYMELLERLPELNRELLLRTDELR